MLSRSGETWFDIAADRVGISLEFGLLTFLKDGKWGLIDTAGQPILAPQFEQPLYYLPRFRGIAWAKRDDGWCAIDRRGNPVPGLGCTDTDPMGGADSRFECKVEP